jgi:hypothetical protein
MIHKADLLALFSQGSATLPGDASSTVGTPGTYVPDLTLWYNWHCTRGTLPQPWHGMSLPQVARAMDVPVWHPVRPWHVETPGVQVETIEAEGARTTTWQTPAGTLTSRWIVGPDGDWWQSENPVKSPADLKAALIFAQAQTYVLDTSQVAERAAEIGEDALLVLSIPRRPYSDLLHDYLGWGEGLLTLAEPEVAEILAALEAALDRLVEQVAALPGDVILSPDNLDGQFISPRAFEQHLSPGYSRTAVTAHRHGKRLVVHVGGPVRHLLAPLAACGVDVVEGIAGPPQGDASLAEARQIAGPDLTLWGGISQDLLLPTHDQAAFETAVAQAAQQAAQDPRAILGIADRVPADADPARLRALPHLIAQA